MYADVENEEVEEVNAGAFSGVQAGRGCGRQTFSGLSMATARCEAEAVFRFLSRIRRVRP